MVIGETTIMERRFTKTLYENFLFYSPDDALTIRNILVILFCVFVKVRVVQHVQFLS